MLKRPSIRRKVRKAVVFMALSILSLFSLSLGMGLLLTKAPESKAQLYMALADDYSQKAQTELLQPEAQAYLLDQSFALAEKALQKSLYNPDLWKQYALILAQRNDIDQAMQAREIALSLGVKEFPTITAMRTLLPEKNFALSDPLLSKTIMR